MEDRFWFESANLKTIECYARQNGSKKSTAHPNWDKWAREWINNCNRQIVTSIDNYHHARKIIKANGGYCTSAKIGGNSVTIFFTK